MRAVKSRSILLCLSSPPQIFCAEEGVLFFHLRGGAGFQRRRTENFSSSSYSSPPHASPPQWRHHDEESKGVKVAVWWDFENCSVPNGVNAFRVPHRITSALRSHGIRGPVSITAFGDVSQLSRSSQDALYTSGVCLNHVPSCGKNSSDRSLLADLVYWVAQNPPPVHFFLISGDRDFANILHRLRMNNYNILLACTDGASGALCSAATVMWQWSTLVRGESLTGRYFNHPPDGLYGSWYGHYRGCEEATSVQPEETMEPIPDAKTRQIPKFLVNRVRQILNSYPEGITLTDLRAELKKNNVVLDKDYFGHKKFSHMLLSMPNFLKFKFNPGDVQPLVYGVIHQRTIGAVDLSSKPATGAGNSTGDENWDAENDRKPSPLIPQPDAENPCHKIEMATASRDNNVGTAAKEQHILNEEGKIVTTHDPENVGTSCKVDVQPSDTQSSPLQKEEAINIDGLIGRIWKKLIGGRSGATEESSSTSQTGSLPCETAQAITSASAESSSNPKRIGSKEEASELKTSGSSVSSSDLVSSKHALCSAADERKRKIKTFQDSLTSSKISSDAGQSAPIKHNGAFRNSSFFNKIFTWCRFWRTNPKDHDAFASKSLSDASEFPRESVERQGLDLHPEMENQNLQPHGNSSGGSVNAKVPTDALHLKAWFQKSCNINGYVSLKEFEKHFERAFDRKLDCSFYGYFTMDDLLAACTADADDHLQSKKVPRGREVTLSHCRDLLLDFLKHNPQGFNIGLFRPMFIRRYGYVLDYQVLGYPKLAALLQIMPGIKIESTAVLPTAMSHPDSGRKGVADEASACTLENKRGIENIIGSEDDSEDPPNDEDRVWDELGPVSKIVESKLEMEEKFGSNESAFADEEFSDPEVSPTAPSGITKRQCNRDTASSAFLEVLDNYYSRQGAEDVEKDKAQDSRDGVEEDQTPNTKEGVETCQAQPVDGLVDCSRKRDVNPTLHNLTRILTAV
ncbi:hypothetical protein Taro_038139 [Colocasia esculenta]|uniref:HTH OST-type domain-containing protein n=1 Tax=Colocasia esculenta TaxID=4460 RepID=A0A843W2K8_COLES|nr:hypothetical protein [Colocasia esculenta]